MFVIPNASELSTVFNISPSVGYLQIPLLGTQFEMNFIKELLLDLTDPSKSLSGPLLKTKILVRKLGNEKINSWLEAELRGYNSKNDLLPDYRRCRGVLKATYVTGTRLSGFSQVNNQPLNIPSDNVDFIREILSMDQTDGITTLEAFVKDGVKGTVAKQLDGDICNWLSSIHRRAGDPTFSVISAQVVASVSVVQVALDHVRNNLLDFIMELDNEYGEIGIDELARDQNPKIESMARKTIINQYGDGAIANSGDNATINSTVVVTKGNRQELRDCLIDNGVSDTDIDELLTVIDVETVNDGKFGNGVSNWIAKMVGKAASGGWEIGVGAAGNLLAQAILNYYG